MTFKHKKRIIIIGCAILLLIMGLTIYCNVPITYNSPQTKHSSFRLNTMSNSALIESFLRNVPGHQFASYAPRTQDEFVQLWLEYSDILQELLTRQDIEKELCDFYAKEKPFKSHDDFKGTSDGFRLDALELLLASSAIQQKLTADKKQALEQLVLEKLEEKRKYPDVYPQAISGYCAYFGLDGRKAPGYD